MCPSHEEIVYTNNSWINIWYISINLKRLKLKFSDNWFLDVAILFVNIIKFQK